MSTDIKTLPTIARPATPLSQHTSPSEKHDVSSKLVQLVEDSVRVVEAERRLGFLSSVKVYRKAVAWSMLLSLTVVMEGFDTYLLGALFAQVPFREAYGRELPNGTYQLTAPWQTGLTNAPRVGQILGLLINGIVAEKIGYRKTMIGSLAILIGFIFVVFFAQSIVQLLVGEFLLGIPWGVFQTLPVTYAAEVCPIHLRAYLTSYINLCWAMGKLISAGTMRGMLTRTDQYAYRIPFALQWIWPIPIIIGVLFAPESPWWLVRQGRATEAKKSLSRLASNGKTELEFEQTLEVMVQTNETEKELVAGARYQDCFKSANRRRTEIACGTWMVQTLCGFSLIPYSTYFYLQAGLNPSNSFSMSIGNSGIAIAGFFTSWFLMRRIGRRTLYMTGLCLLITLHLTIGFVSLADRDNVAAQWAIGSMLLVISFSYNCTIGPVCYPLVAEMPSTRLRTKTVVLARNAYLVADIISNILIPRMLNPTAWNWGAKSGFFWAGMSSMCLLYAFFRVPETKDRTYQELDLLFEQKVPPRKFSSAMADQIPHQA
jgi:MFS transporter, SP family, general alpha glucoside:H+ symporter